MKKHIKNLLAVMMLGMTFPAFSQISIAPTSVFLDENGIASIYVTNPAEVPQEVSVSFVFGYPGNDDLGNLIMVYGDSVKEKQFGMGDRLRSFPRTFVLAPQQQQTVRLQLRPDRSLPAGTYFTRVKVTSNNVAQEVGQPVENEVATQVNFKFDQVIAVFFKQGQTSTGLELGDLQMQQDTEKIRVIAPYQTTGNSPFLGSVIASLKDSNNKTVTEEQQSIALYFGGKKGLDIAIPEGLPSGEYQVEMRFETKRSDIPSTDLVQASSVAKRVFVKIP
ncbi:hypothetical protein [Mariniradius sediminis]|uniref:P pilus assembly protein, chaperone PapD n=1 Tax=Mariniradius sediminis TaxID=2909237 RepID=A0ABS9BYS9_9BACT|nr:hypothetical protein [Mariniradius sediminis]MCF1752849.1 hypothetical protein [Mariniradius sediminis]